MKYLISLPCTLALLASSSIWAQEVSDPKLVVANPMITKIAYDAEKDGTRIGLTFSVTDKSGKPVNTLKAGRDGNFKVFIDQVEETSFETLQDNSVTRPPMGITLVLDTSYSMEDQAALRKMKDAAQKFVSRLSSSSSPFNFQYYQFATQVQKIESLKEINTQKAFGQFTSLYSALKIAIDAHPQNVILLFTDGADNKSPDNRQVIVNTVDEIQQLIEQHKTVIHTVKLGIEESNDSKGVDNKEILRRVSANGSLRYVVKADELVQAFEEVAAKMAYPYYFEYLCPRTRAGSYKILLQIDRQGVASDKSRFNPEASFELPFEIFGNDNRHFNVPGAASIPLLWTPIFYPTPDGRSWALKKWANDGVFTRMNDLSEKMSDLTVSFRDFQVDYNTSEVSFRVVYEGSELFVTAFHLGIKNHDGVGPTTYITQFDSWANPGATIRSTRWNVHRTFLASKDGIEFKVLAGGRAEMSTGIMKLKVNLSPNVSTWLQVTGGYSSNKEAFILQGSTDSIRFIR